MSLFNAKKLAYQQELKALPFRAIGQPKQVSVDQIPNAKITQVYEPTPFEPTRPPGLNDDEWLAFRMNFTGDIRGSRLVEIENAELHKPAAWIVTEDGSAVTDYYLEQIPVTADKLLTFQLSRSRFENRPKTKLAGTSFLVCGLSGENYYHFLTSYLSGLHVLQQAGWSFDDIDHFVVPMQYPPNAERAPARFMLQYLQYAGVQSHKMVVMDNTPYQCERLIFNEVVGRNRVPPTWMLDYVKSLVPVVPSPSKTKRIYISRKDGARRKTGRRDELETLLERHRFETVTLSDYNVPEQAALFREAEVILAPHGAGLANLVFAGKQAKVIELLPRNHLQGTFYTISQVLGIEHHLLLSDDEPFSDWRWRRYTYSKLTVDIDAVASLLDRLEAETA